jgi:selenide,water dikinase
MPGVLVGFENSDDAGVFQLTTDIAVVQTVDFFSPIVDDAWSYGRISAANALSDIYAMGGVPKMAVSILGFPPSGLDVTVLGEIMKGGMQTLNEAGVVLLGGHSVRDDEVKFGYAVTGTVDPARVKQNTGARVGDRIILTKPLGTGLITTALKRSGAKTEHVQAAIESMMQLNKRSSEVSLQFGVSTMTDVTGFGLVGHACEVARASQIEIRLDHTKVPLLPGTLDYSRAGFCAGGLTSNEEFFGKSVFWESSVPAEFHNVLFDPQTSGGLLIFCQPADALRLVNSLRAVKIDAVEVGFAAPPSEHLLTVS